jgi:hypothetical protein
MKALRSTDDGSFPVGQCRPQESNSVVCHGDGGGGDSIQEYTAANPYYPPQEKTFGVRIRVSTHAQRPPSVRRLRRPILPNQSRETACAISRTSHLPKGRSPARRFDTSQLRNARQPFRCDYAPQHHLSVHQRHPTALPVCRPNALPTSVSSLLGFYSGHSPSLRRLNHVVDQTTHRGPTRLP